MRLLQVSGKQVSSEQMNSQVFQRKWRKSPGPNLHNIVVAKVQRLQGDQRTEPLWRYPRDFVVCSENRNRGITESRFQCRWSPSQRLSGSDVSTPHNRSKQPLGLEACHLVYKVITNKVFKKKNLANYADDEAHSLSESAADEHSNFPRCTPPKLQCRSCLC